ncbi:hypothetical protein PRNP1_001069 [Phytophthora ramorum]
MAALIRLAVFVASVLLYYAPPPSLLALVWEEVNAVVVLRTWLTLAASLVALTGVLSTQLVAASCVHGVLHFLRSGTAGPSSGSLEWPTLLAFVMVLRYTLFPPVESELVKLQWHRRQLRGFFDRHDKQYVPLVDTLLEDYAGRERLLYARIRRAYRERLELSTRSA